MWSSLLLASFIVAQCTNPRIRPEWSQLTTAQKRSFLNAVTALKERPKGSANSPTTWNYEQFAQAHWDYQAANHDKAPFFLWHREYLYQYEMALRTIDPNLSLPYWDWTLDSQNPGAADIMQAQYFGGAGNSTSHCVTTGVAAGWEGLANNNGCLKRCTNWSSLYSPEGVSGLISAAATFQQLQRNIEAGPHGAVHLQYGGDCGAFSTMASANDPIFFIHHAMVDKVWFRWQTACPEFLTSYSGSMNERMSPFPVTAREVMDVHADRYCYTYSSSRGDTPIRGRCLNPSSSSGASSPLSSPTPSTDLFWIQHRIQQLLPGTENFHSNLLALAQRKAAQNLLLAKRDVVMDSLPLPDNYPEGVSPIALGPTPTGTLQATTTTTMDDGAYPTAAPTMTPFPEYTHNPNYTVKAPAPTDRNDKYHIRYPAPLPVKLLHRMNYDEKVVENIRGYVKMIVDEVNNRKEYVSPAALVNKKHKCRKPEHK